MCLNVDVEKEKNFAQWQLDIGHEKHTDHSDKIILPQNLRLQKNTVEGLINHIYPGLFQLQPPFHQYFSECMMLSSHNNDVDNLNDRMLKTFPGEEQIFFCEDSVVNDRPDEGELMYPAEYLNSINCSGLPLEKLRLKIGYPVIVLRNLFLAEGVCNKTRGIVTEMST